jgi:hypothetical protein
LIDILMNQTNANKGLIFLKKTRRTHLFDVSLIRPQTPIGDDSRLYGTVRRNVLAEKPVGDIEVQQVFLASFR